MNNFRESEFYKKMDFYTACSTVEGYSGNEPTQIEIGTAWQWLLDTGLGWKMQGFYGRTMTNLLENGLLLPPIKDHKDAYGNVVKGTHGNQK